jgi:hypothetical protein
VSRAAAFGVLALLVFQVVILAGIREHARTLALRPVPEAAPGPCPGPRVIEAVLQ